LGFWITVALINDRDSSWTAPDFHEFVSMLIDAPHICEMQIYTCPGANVNEKSWAKWVAPWMVAEAERFMASPGPGCAASRRAGVAPVAEL